MRAAFPILYTPSDHESKFIAHFGEAGLKPARPAGTESRRTYVICFTNRCGSNLLAELISTNPAFGKAGEYLNAKGVLKIAGEKEHRTMAQHLTWLMRRKASAQGVFGVKMSYKQLFFFVRSGFVSGMFGDVRFVHIRRRDVLEQAVSHGIASQTKAWDSKQTGKSDPASAAFKPQHIARLMDGINEANAKFRTFFDVYGINVIDVVYEDLIQDLQLHGDRVLREIGFMGAEAEVRPDMISLRKQGNALNDSFARRFREFYQLA